MPVATTDRTGPGSQRVIELHFLAARVTSNFIRSDIGTRSKSVHVRQCMTDGHMESALTLRRARKLSEF